MHAWRASKTDGWIDGSYFFASHRWEATWTCLCNRPLSHPAASFTRQIVSVSIYCASYKLSIAQTSMTIIKVILTMDDLRMVAMVDNWTKALSLSAGIQKDIWLIIGYFCAHSWALDCTTCYNLDHKQEQERRMCWLICMPQTLWRSPGGRG